MSKKLPRVRTPKPTRVLRDRRQRKQARSSVRVKDRVQVRAEEQP